MECIYGVHIVYMCNFVIPSNICQGFSGGSLERILMHVETGKVVNLDRWLLFSVPNETVPHTVSFSIYNLHHSNAVHCT